MNYKALLVLCCLTWVPAASFVGSPSRNGLQQIVSGAGIQGSYSSMTTSPILLQQTSLSSFETSKRSSSSSSSSSKPLSSKGPATVSWDWKKLAADVFDDDQRPVILFDGVCNFCNGGVNLCLDLDSKGHFRFASLQSKVGQALLLSNGKAANDLSSIVLVESPKKAFFESDAILGIAQELDVLPPVVRTLTKVLQGTTPRVLRDGTYHVIANNRYVFGEKDGPTCRLDFDGEFEGRFLEDPTEVDE